jgi:hypothetical protein
LLIDKVFDLVRNNLPFGVALSLPMVAILLYSTYLQWRVNELDFFTFYYVRPPDLNSYITNFFEGRPVGMTLDELLRESDRLEATRLFYELANYGSRETVEGWARRTRQFLHFRNYYWWGDRKEELPR